MEQKLSGFRYNQTTNSTEYKKLEESHDSVMRNYSFVILAATIFTLLKSFAFFTFATIASRNIHNLVLEKILSAAMIFFDTHLSGNILNRFSRDLGILDEQMPYTIHEVTRVSTTLGFLFVEQTLLEMKGNHLNMFIIIHTFKMYEIQWIGMGKMSWETFCERILWLFCLKDKFYIYSDFLKLASQYSKNLN